MFVSKRISCCLSQKVSWRENAVLPKDFIFMPGPQSTRPRTGARNTAHRESIIDARTSNCKYKRENSNQSHPVLWPFHDRRFETSWLEKFVFFHSYYDFRGIWFLPIFCTNVNFTICRSYTVYPDGVSTTIMMFLRSCCGMWVRSCWRSKARAHEITINAMPF